MFAKLMNYIIFSIRKRLIIAKCGDKIDYISHRYHPTIVTSVFGKVTSSVMQSKEKNIFVFKAA